MKNIVVYYSSPADFDAAVQTIGTGFRIRPENANHYGGHVLPCDVVFCKAFPDIDADYAEAGIPSFESLKKAKTSKKKTAS